MQVYTEVGTGRGSRVQGLPVGHRPVTGASHKPGL